MKKKKEKKHKKKIIFLDRDNTLNYDPGYLGNPEEVRILPGVKESLHLLSRMGYEFIVLSNQSGISRGYISEEDVDKVNQRISQKLAPVKILRYYICPHRDEDNCPCRKPSAGLLEKALADYRISLTDSYMVGDRFRDLTPGEKFGIPGVLIKREGATDEDAGIQPPGNMVFSTSSFEEAARYIIENGFEQNFRKKIFSGVNDIAFKNRLARYKLSGKKIVFTNGVFDILHTGHIQYLYQASRLGKKLIIGLNADSTVKKLKGKDRPVNSFFDRAIHLAALDFVDAVFSFSEDTPVEAIKVIQPDIHVKGGDYKKEDLPEYSTVQSYGGEIEILPFRNGYSTTSIIRKIRNGK